MKTFFFIFVFSLCLCGDIKVLPYPKKVDSGSDILKIPRCALEIVYINEYAKAYALDTVEGIKDLIIPPKKHCVKYQNNQPFPIEIDTKGLDCTKESYELIVSDAKISIKAKCPIGIIRAATTLWQLIKVDSASKKSHRKDFAVIENIPIKIKDSPRFEHRGLMIDTSRHYLSLATLKRVIDGLMYAKMSVLHWHLVDDDSFPMQSKNIPGLAENASFSPKQIYKIQDIKDMVQYAKSKGVRVIPEIDCPGHSRAVGDYKPLNDIVTCYNSVRPYRVPDVYRIHGGPPTSALDPSMDLTYQYAENILKDLVDYFKDDYIHLGGDEVMHSCWKARKSIEEFMKKNNIKDYDELMTYFIKRMRDILVKLSDIKKVIYWSNPDTFKIKYKDEDILQYWGYSNNISQLPKLYPKNKFILSPADHLYLDCGIGNKYGGPAWCGDYKTWLTMFLFEPTNYLVPQNMILGAEACAWGEIVTDATIDLSLWPRLAAMAETLWSPKRTPDFNLTSLILRLNYFSELVNEKGILSNAVCTQYCEVHTNECFQKWEK